MTIPLIICGVLCLLVYVLDSAGPGGRTSPFPDPWELPPVEEKADPEELSPAQHNRRVQQVLKRQSLKLKEWEVDLGYQDTETRIGQKLLGLNKTEVQIGSKRVELQQMLLQITQQKNLLEVREQGLVLEGRKIELRELLADVKQRENMVVLRQQEIRIDGKKIEARKLLDQIEYRGNLLKLEQKEVTLNGKRVELKELLAHIIFESKMVKVGKAELALGWRELEHAYKEKSFQLRQLLQDVKNQMEELRLSKLAFNLYQKEEALRLYEMKLTQMEQHISRMYEIRQEWLKLQNRENHIAYRDEQLKLQHLYNTTQVKIKELRLKSGGWGLLDFIEDKWLHAGGMS